MVGYTLNWTAATGESFNNGWNATFLPSGQALAASNTAGAWNGVIAPGGGNAAFGFIPGTIGVYEGGNGLILKTLHLGTAQGVALALIRRAGILFATAIGVIVLLWRTAEGGANRLKKDRN